MIDGLTPYPAYKDSGVPWLGEVPEHWRLQRMKTLLHERSEKGFPDEPLLAATQTKGVVRKDQYENRTVLALKDLHLLKLVQVGDFVISLRSFQGGIEYARERGIISPAYTILYPGDPSVHGYLAWLFKAKPFIEGLSLFVTGIRQGQNVDYERLSRSALPLPSADEQVAIVRFLDHADRKIRRYIRAKQKLIKLLEEQKQAIIHRAVTRGLDPNVRLKPSGVEWLGEVPEHWTVVALGVATESIQTGPFGSQLHASEYVAGGVPVINPSHLRDGQILSDPEIAITDRKAHELDRHRLRLGDIVAARRGELGRCALVRNEEENWICGTGSLRIRPRPGIFDSEYLAQVFGSSGVRGMLSISSIGATMDNLNAGMVARLRLPCPPLREQHIIMELIHSTSLRIRQTVNTQQREIAFLREYRTRLIADVVTGKLDVREAAADLSSEVTDTEPDGEDAMEDELAAEMEEVEV